MVVKIVRFPRSKKTNKQKVRETEEGGYPSNLLGVRNGFEGRGGWKNSGVGNNGSIY